MFIISQWNTQQVSVFGKYCVTFLIVSLYFKTLYFRFDPATNKTTLNYNVTLNTPVKPTDQQKIAGAMSTVVLENTPLVIDNTPVTVLQDSPYIFIVTQNGTEIKGKYRSQELYVKCFSLLYIKCTMTKKSVPTKG